LEVSSFYDSIGFKPLLSPSNGFTVPSTGSCNRIVFH
jgi:hypothetical protein